MTLNYQDIMEELLTVVKTRHANSSIGFLPPNGGIALSYSGGDIDTDLAGHSYISLRVTISAKGQTQDECVRLLDKAHSVLQRIERDGETWRIYGGRIVGNPSLAAKDASGWWIVTSNMRIKAFSERSDG